MSIQSWNFSNFEKRQIFPFLCFKTQIAIKILIFTQIVFVEFPVFIDPMRLFKASFITFMLIAGSPEPSKVVRHIVPPRDLKVVKTLEQIGLMINHIFLSQ